MKPGTALPLLLPWNQQAAEARLESVKLPEKAAGSAPRGRARGAAQRGLSGGGRGAGGRCQGGQRGCQRGSLPGGSAGVAAGDRARRVRGRCRGREEPPGGALEARQAGVAASERSPRPWGVPSSESGWASGPPGDTDDTAVLPSRGVRSARGAEEAPRRKGAASLPWEQVARGSAAGRKAKHLATWKWTAIVK